MSGFLCSMVGATFATVTVAAEVLRSKKGIIAQGNAQVSTAQSKFGGSSALFDGNTDALYITDYSGFTFTGDFTIEMFVRMTQYGEQTFLDMREGSGGVNTGALLYRDSSSNLKFELGGSAILTDADPNILTNQWDHIAVSRSGTSIKLFVNGTETASATSSASGTPKNFYIGRNSFSATSGNTVGYLDEIRISKTARYTAAFTAPTTPFVNDDNTLLLIHANGTNGTTFFEDDNGATTTRTAKTIVANGNAQLSTAQEKFGQSSVLFDGTGDYLQLDSFGTVAGSGQDFTIEFWVRWSSLTAGQGLVSDRPPTSSGYGSTNFYLEKNSSNTIYFGYSGGGDITGTSSVAANTWYHMAIVRSSGTTKFYLDGTTSGTTLSYTGVVGDGTLSIGAVVGQYMNGYIDELRISNVARYTANFTAPTTTFLNDSNTLLLIHAEGADASTTITDDNSGRSPVGLWGTGSAALSTTQSKFGGSSLRTVAANNTKIAFNSQPLDAVGTGDFTIEFWIRLDTVTQTTKVFLFTNEGNAGRRGIQLNNQTVLYTTDGTTRITTANVLSATTWHHIAVVRVGTTTRIYVDGTDRGNYASDTQSLASTGNNTIANLATGYTADGYMDEFRISKVARYTAAFTAPTAPFVNDADTTLLIHMDGTNGLTVFRDDNGIVGSTPKVLSPQGNTQISTAQYKFGSSSAYFDGTGDYLRLGQPGNFNFGSDNWTIEGFIRPTNNLSGYKVVYNHNDNGTDRSWITIQLENSTLKSWGTASTSSWSIYSDLSFGSLSVDTWYHFALVRDSSTMRAFLNGTQINTASCTGWVIPAQTAAATLSAVPASYFYGWMDGIRISNTARYGASGYTTPTSAFTQDSNTLMLLNFEGANASTTFIDSAGRTQQGVISNASAAISTTQSKFGGTSLYLNGTSQFLTLPGASNTAFTTEDFTVEAWIYPISSTGNFITNLQNATNNGWQFAHWSLGRLLFCNNTSAGTPGIDVRFSSDNAYTLNTWNHIAVCRTGSTLTMYANGNRVYSATDLPTLKAGNAGLRIGHSNGIADGAWNDAGAYSNSYSNEIRISSTVRYTGATYTQPTGPFQNDDNTLLLLHNNGTNGSTVFFDDNGAKPYTP